MIYDLPEARQKQVAVGLFVIVVIAVLSVTVWPVWRKCRLRCGNYATADPPGQVTSEFAGG